MELTGFANGCARKGRHLPEHAEKAREIIIWKEFTKKESVLVDGRFSGGMKYALYHTD